MNAPLFRLATTPLPQPHKFAFGSQTYVPAKASISGHPQTERACVNCGVIKVHVLSPPHYDRLWRWPGETAQAAVEPECVGVNA